MKKSEELLVITKTYDLILWSCNHTSRFPRQHRFILGERLEPSLYDLLETLIQAKYTCDRQPLLELVSMKSKEANAETRRKERSTDMPTCLPSLWRSTDRNSSQAAVFSLSHNLRDVL
jgi:hypothetical protein